MTQRGGFVIHKSFLKSHSEQGCVDGIINKVNWKVLMSQVVLGHGSKRSVTGSEGMNALTCGLYKAELQCSLN